MDRSSIKQIDQTFYDRNKSLGQGKYGTVYLGFCQKNKTFEDISNIPVAVKVINFQKLLTNSELTLEVINKRLNNEITNLQLVQSENIVRLYDLQKSKKNFYFVCQLCNGCSFDAYLKKKERLTEKEAMKFFKDILSGFKHLH